MNFNQEKYKYVLLHRLSEIIAYSLPSSQSVETGINSLFFVRKDSPTQCQHNFTNPMALLGIQGQKRINHGHGEKILSPGMLMLNCVESPSASAIIEATPEKPYLALYFLLDRKIIAELLGEMEAQQFHPAQKTEFILAAPIDFLSTIVRLAEITLQPDKISILGPLLLRELHYLLLSGPYGMILRDLYMRGTMDSRIIEMIAWLKQNINQSFSIDFLSRKANMSASSLHRHFKSVTGFSPLQYQKELRLLEAQRLMLTENEHADIAAMKVGYESVTQFNREYKRKFGLPPHKDIAKRKTGLS